MTSLDLQSEPPLPADCQAEGVARGEDYYEQSAAAALLGMATAMLMLPPSEYQSGTAKRELEDPRQLSDSRGSSSDDLSAYSSGSEVKRQRTETREHGGGPPPGTCRFQCKYPECMKMYSSTDAVRKHCRKRHLEWLRKLDLMAAHDRYLPKPALYCRWGGEADAL